MAPINRRSFLRRCAGVALAGAAAVVSAKVPAPALAFRADAFSSIDFVKQYEVHGARITPFDVLYGYRVITPELACRVSA